LESDTNSLRRGDRSLQEVYDAIQIMDSIAHEQGESCGNAALRSDIQIISSGLRVSLRFDNLSVLGSEKFDEFFEIVDVLYGPFNLKARMGYRLL